MGAAAAIIFEWSLAREVTTSTLKVGCVVALVGDGVLFAHPHRATTAIEMPRAWKRIMMLVWGD
jgi:hypothetical protein